MNKKILITGVDGFIGKSLWNFVHQEFPKSEVWGISRRKKQTSILKCDLIQENKIKTILADLKPDLIFHCAGGRPSDEKKVFESNILTTKSLLTAVKSLPKHSPRIIIPGTAAEYGKVPSNKLITERQVAKPAAWYGFVKHMQTSLGLLYAKEGLDVVITRIFNVLGANTPTTLAAGRFAKEIIAIEEKHKEAVVRTGNLSGKRDFLDIDDVCRALFLLTEKGKSGEIYNVCSGKPVGIKTLLKKFLKNSKVADIQIKENKKDSAASFDCVGSSSKLQKLTKWKAKVSLNKSVQNTLVSYRSVRK